MYLNSPHSIDPGTRNFFLSISGSVDLAAFSTITGILSGYFVNMRFASADLFSMIQYEGGHLGGSYRMQDRFVE
jgi:hypothetical protein